MPRVKLAGDTYKDRDLSELIRRYKYGKRLTNAEAGKLVGVCERTWRTWEAEPSKIPVGKLRLIARKLSIPAAEMLPHII